MSKKSLVTLFLLVVGLFALARPIPAQTSAGNITGIITDQSMAVLPNAKLTVTNQATGLKRETFTNGVGEYRVPCCLWVLHDPCGDRRLQGSDRQGH